MHAFFNGGDYGNKSRSCPPLGHRSHVLPKKNPVGDVFEGAFIASSLNRAADCAAH